MSSDPNFTARFDSDLDLVRCAQQGDSDAFACLFHAHKARIYSVCLRMTNNTAEAEDLTQDAFLQVFRKLATFRGDSALSTRRPPSSAPTAWTSSRAPRPPIGRRGGPARPGTPPGSSPRAGWERPPARTTS